MIKFWAIVENIAYEGKTAATTFWANLWKNWATLYSNIWSH